MAREGERQSGASKVAAAGYRERRRRDERDGKMERVFKKWERKKRWTSL